MKIFEITSNPVNWEIVCKDTMAEINALLEVKADFLGGFCFHLAAALFLKAKSLGIDAIIIGDHGHVALLDQDQYVSVDGNGVHDGETALHGHTVKTFKTVNGLKRAVGSGPTSAEQLASLALVIKHFQ